MQTVRAWSQSNRFDYRWLGDELFAPIASVLLDKIGEQRVIASDLGRLYALKQGLETHERVLWLDADFLIFNPAQFILPIDKLPSDKEFSQGYMVGREVWIQEDPQRGAVRLKSYVKVHNAFLMFDRENSFLDFYLSHAQQLLHEYDGPMPPQFVGPKLLTAIHNVVGCPVMETAGMLSPLVIGGLLSGGRDTEAINLFQKRSKEKLAAANLCSSLTQKSNCSEQQMNKLIRMLLSTGEIQ